MLILWISDYKCFIIDVHFDNVYSLSVFSVFDGECNVRFDYGHDYINIAHVKTIDEGVMRIKSFINEAWPEAVHFNLWHFIDFEKEFSDV